MTRTRITGSQDERVEEGEALLFVSTLPAAVRDHCSMQVDVRKGMEFCSLTRTFLLQGNSSPSWACPFLPFVSVLYFLCMRIRISFRVGQDSERGFLLLLQYTVGVVELLFFFFYLHYGVCRLLLECTGFRLCSTRSSQFRSCVWRVDLVVTSSVWLNGLSQARKLCWSLGTEEQSVCSLPSAPKGVQVYAQPTCQIRSVSYYSTPYRLVYCIYTFWPSSRYCPSQHPRCQTIICRGHLRKPAGGLNWYSTSQGLH